MPAVSGNVVVSVADTSWMVVGQTVFVGTAGFFTVNTIGSGVSVTLTNTGNTGNAAPTTVINNNQGVSPGGVQGSAGSAGATGATGPQGIQGPTGSTGAAGKNAFTTTTNSFIVPNPGGTVSISVADTSWMASGQYLLVGTGGFFSVSSVTNSTTFVGIAAFLYSPPGTSIGGGAPVVAAGVPGPAGPALVNDYAVIKENTTVPSPSQNVWVKRTLNLIAISPAGAWLTLASNQFTLNPGSTYRLRASAPAANVGGHLIRLYNVGLAAVVTEGYGTVEQAASSTNYTRSIIECQFVAPAAPNNVFEIDHFVDGASGAFGDTTITAPEKTFCIVQIERVAGT